MGCTVNKEQLNHPTKGKHISKVTPSAMSTVTKHHTVNGLEGMSTTVDDHRIYSIITKSYKFLPFTQT